MANVAFIGLGNMGGPMAKNLLGAGHQVCVFDLVPEACQQLADAGATVAASASEAVDGVDYVGATYFLPMGKEADVCLFI